MKLKELLTLLVLFSFVVTSCGPSQSPTPDVMNPSPNIEVQITGTESKEFDTETISQPNCGGNAETESVVERTKSIQYVMEVENGVSVNVNGQVGFAGTDVELGTTVASQLGVSYGTSDTITRSISVKASPGTNMQHVIRQVEVWKVGEAKVSVGGQQTIIPFKFRSDFAIGLVGSNQIPCPSETQPVTLTPEITSSDATTTPAGLLPKMDVRLAADTTSGRHPLSVHFDARGSFFVDANSAILPCGVCNYTWYVYQNSNLLNTPKRSDAGTFTYKFGKSGDYRVVVKVCRGSGDSDCAFDAEDISVG